MLCCAWRVTLKRQIKAVDQENRGERRREREKEKRKVFNVFFSKKSQGKKKDIVTLLSSIFAKKKGGVSPFLKARSPAGSVSMSLLHIKDERAEHLKTKKKEKGR